MLFLHSSFLTSLPSINILNCCLRFPEAFLLWFFVQTAPICFYKVKKVFSILWYFNLQHCCQRRGTVLKFHQPVTAGNVKRGQMMNNRSIWAGTTPQPPGEWMTHSTSCWSVVLQWICDSTDYLRFFTMMSALFHQGKCNWALTAHNALRMGWGLQREHCSFTFNEVTSSVVVTLWVGEVEKNRIAQASANQIMFKRMQVASDIKCPNVPGERGGSWWTWC